MNKITYKFSQNPQALTQYYALVTKIYSEAFKVDPEDFRLLLKKDKQTKNSNVLVVKNGDMVVGGARITISHRASSVGLPMEKYKPSFSRKSFLPGYSLENKSCFEVCRLVIRKEFRGRQIVPSLFSCLIQFAKDRGCEVGMWLCTRRQAVYYKQAVESLCLGVKVKLFENVTAPHHKLFQNMKQKLILSTMQLSQGE